MIKTREVTLTLRYDFDTEEYSEEEMIEEALYRAEIASRVEYEVVVH